MLYRLSVIMRLACYCYNDSNHKHGMRDEAIDKAKLKILRCGEA